VDPERTKEPRSESAETGQGNGSGSTVSYPSDANALPIESGKEKSDNIK